MSEGIHCMLSWIINALFSLDMFDSLSLKNKGFQQQQKASTPVDLPSSAGGGRVRGLVGKICAWIQ